MATVWPTPCSASSGKVENTMRALVLAFVLLQHTRPASHPTPERPSR
jgi:hypothetical protein